MCLGQLRLSEKYEVLAHEANWVTPHNDMKNAPFKEILVPSDSNDADAIAARKRLGDVLAELNPAAGVTSLSIVARRTV